MLYPDFEDLIALKTRKTKVVHSATLPAKTARQGNHSSPFRGQGLEFDAVRQYVLGDDIRSIDWRVTARTGSPHLKLFKEERERQMIVCVDMNEPMRFGTKRTFKSVQAARVAAFLGWQGLAQHDSVSGCLFGDVREGIQYYPPKKTRRSFCAMLKTLTLPPANEHQIPIHQVLARLNRIATPGSLVYLISDFINLDFHFQEESNLSLLCKNCNLVFIAVNDQADKVIPPIGTIVFSSKGSKLAVNTQDASGRSAYAEFWRANREKLYQIANRYRIPLIELSTESEIPRDLILALKGVAKRRVR